MESTKNYTTNVASLFARAQVCTVAPLHWLGLALCFMLLSVFVQGCGSGGYPGSGIASLTASTITLDAGQSMAVGATTSSTLPLSWTLSGNCSGAMCGSLSSSTGTNITYTAPSSVATPFQVQLNATIAGTTSVRTVAISVNPAPALSGTPPPGTVGVPYSFTFTTSGGTTPSKLSIQSGTLPAGLTFNAATATIAGTPTAAGTSPFALQLIDGSDVPFTVTANKTITIAAVGNTTSVSVSGNPPNATVGSAYSTTLQATGGTAPYTWSVVSGALPAGLSLNASTGVISGTPSASEAANVVIQASDAAGNTGTGTYAITVGGGASASPVSVSSGTLPSGTVGSPYMSPVAVAGGTAPYTCSLAGSALPAGLSLNANCYVTGTPTTAGTSTVNVTVTDAGNPAQTTTAPQTITINPASTGVTISSPPAATVNVPYTGTLPVSGGTAPYTCSLAGGTLPAGLTLGANCTISGTPTTVGSSPVTVKATDSSSPMQSGTGTVTVTVNPGTGSLVLGNPPAATVNTPYTGTLPVSGGTAPYTCSLAGGTLPAGLTLGTNCTITGTPTTAGSSMVTVKATDAGNPAQSGTGTVTVTVNPATSSLVLGNPPAATVSTPYTGTVPVTGGTAPYTCSLAGGTLPAGLTLGANCSISGTPTTAGSSTVMVKATDSANPQTSSTGSVTVTVNPATGSLVLGNPTAATVNTPYTGTVPVTGGTAPYTCSLAGGTLPAGLTLGTNCAITGTPTTAGSSMIMVKATDSANPQTSSTGSVTVTVNPSAVTLALGNPPLATVNTPYTGTVPVTGGSGSYTCNLASGTLPAGLTLGTNCIITGTPTVTGSTTVQVTATDVNAPGTSQTGPVVVSVQPIPAVTFAGSLANAVVNQPYTQTLTAAGGVGPYTYAVTAGALPAGITLSSAGVVSGTPTTPGATGFTVTATDSEGTPQTASLPLTLLVTYAPTASDALLQGPYAFLFQGYDDVVAGVLAYRTATAGSITADGNGAITAGEQDSNHQISNPTGNTVPTRTVLGTYTIGTDRRGSLTLTAFNADGTVANTTTYAIALQAAVAPATIAAAGDLIEFDGDQAVGTKGSGTLLAQTSGAFTTGLAGSYAFGISGDTPCLPTCTVGIAAGPAVTVGQFAASGGTVTGTADTNIASTNFASSALSGTYGAADNNGRVQLTLNSASLAGVPFPTDYAAYVVDANRVILLSTDKHASYVLQAGTAQVQRQATFSNAALGAAYVGYENSPVNPGLLSVTLQDVLNLSTATVFRGTGNGNGTCTTTNVDSSGTTGVVNGLGTLVSAPVVTALLGSYQTLGNSACTVAANGRAVLNYPAPSAVVTLPGLGLTPTPAPRVVYLTDANSGYFLETGYAGLGMLEAQTGAPFSNASLLGTFVYGSIPASTLATINSSGEFTADGAGNTTSTVDRNVGVGTINVLQLGVTATATYTITDIAAGRFALSSGEVVYEIAPGRFVLLEPELLNTSAYVALLF